MSVGTKLNVNEKINTKNICLQTKARDQSKVEFS